MFVVSFVALSPFSSQSAISAIRFVLLCAFISLDHGPGLDAKNIPWTTPCTGLVTFDLATQVWTKQEVGPPTHTESSLHANGIAVL